MSVLAEGYLHPRYAEAFAGLGQPRTLNRSGGWLLERGIPGTEHRDAMGPYPRLVCDDWSELCSDIAELRDGLVSLVVATDALADVSPTELERCFDSVEPYKEHHIVDFAERRVSRHHAQRARLAARDGVTVARVERPLDQLDTWVGLYGHLVDRHGITGLQAFSRESFEVQLSVPGLRMFLACHEGTPVAAQLWYVHGPRAYSHLTAANERAYKLRATFRLYHDALDAIGEECEVADLGAGAGARTQADDGLSAFKAGWASESRTSYLCGAVFDRATYDELSGSDASSDYFPAYRSGELD